MTMSPKEIKQQQFRVRFRGFDIQEVDGFLEHISEWVESLARENETLKEKNKNLEYEIQGYKQREETFKRAMVNSQKVLDEMKENARKSAEIIVADAEVRAEKILNKAHARLAQLHEDIGELKRQRMQIEVQIRSVLDSHSRLLDIGKESSDAMEQQDAKLKLFKQSR